MVFTTRVSLEVLEKIHETVSTFCSGYGLVFANVDINNSIVDERYRSSSHSLTETDSFTMILSISSCDLSTENEVINLVNQANNKSINETSPDLLFEIKKLRIRNPNKIIIGNFNINSLPNKFEQLKDIVMQNIDILVLTGTKLGDTFPTASF